MNNCVLFCSCKAHNIKKKDAARLRECLQKMNIHIVEVDDLCAISLHEPHLLNDVGKQYEKKTIIACYPRAIKHMFIQNGVEFGDFDVLSYKTNTFEEIEQQLLAKEWINEGASTYETIKTTLDVPGWYPIVDQTLCNQCGKCANFCLFGVYSHSRDQLKVVEPLSCKNHCPACGRTCPTSAIMFPRLREKSVLAGAEPDGQKVVIDQGSLLSSLNARNQNRKSIFQPGVLEMAEEERKKALQELKNTNDVFNKK